MVPLSRGGEVDVARVGEAGAEAKVLGTMVHKIKGHEIKGMKSKAWPHATGQ
jgi:hypothetical protein